MNCRDKLHILELQTLANDYAGTAAISSILSIMLNDINALDDTGISLACSVSASKTYNFTKQTNYLQALRDLTEGIEFRITGDILEVHASIGSDLSNSVEFRFDIDNL